MNSSNNSPRDSVEKVIIQYFASLTAKPFTYKGVRYDVPRLTVSTNLLRAFTCFPNCGACCRAFTLDYLPSEPQPQTGFTERMIQFNGYEVPLMSDLQKGRVGGNCRHLSPSDGRCGIHTVRPFSCDFELIRFMYRGATAHMSHRPFTRSWNMKRLDGGRGALCEFDPPTAESVRDTIRKMGRFQEWADHFGLPTRGAIVVDWIESIKDNPSAADDLVLPGHTAKERA